MKNILVCAFLIFISCCKVAAQFDALHDDSLVHLLKYTYTTISQDRISVCQELMNRFIPDQPAFDSLKNLVIIEAETSRNRNLICDANNKVAQVYLNFSNSERRVEEAKTHIDNCMKIATENNLNVYKVSSLIKYARYYRAHNEKQKALDYNNQAISLATSISNDSLLSEAYNSIANTWNVLDNKLSRFEAFLASRNFAEKSGSYNLICESYANLGTFYNETSQYEKSKDYFVMQMDKGREWSLPGQVFGGMQGMATAYALENNKDMALYWGNKALHFADSLNLKLYRIQIYLFLVNFYINYETPQQGLDFLNTHKEVLNFINDVGFGYQIYKIKAAIKTQDKQYDSAVYYMNTGAPFEYGQPLSFSEKFNFAFQYAHIYQLMGNKDLVQQKLLLAKSFADSAGDFDMLKDVSHELDSISLVMGDYKNAYAYNKNYYHYKDTLEALGRQKDLLNVEIESTNKRAEEQKIEGEAKLRKRDNLEYMGITAAIATIFIVLVLFGVFKMSPAIIKALGFFAFIFLFEFITLLLDKQIHEITHGEPWKILAIKIILIAMLLPLHHWLEEKVLHYLTNKAHRLRFFHRNKDEASPEVFDKKL